MAEAVVYNGDCLEVLREFPDNSIDAIVTDPPYELGFMGKAWDGQGIAYNVELWKHCLRVLKPGGHLLSFGGTRTWHRMACAIEDAGFELRDSIAWLYGSGFPKSLDVSKAIDKAAGATREVTGTALGARNGNGQNVDYGAFGSAADGRYDVTAASTPDAVKWQGWGTALKPAHEPIVVARKPLIGTVAANVLAHGTGAINIDATRVGMTEKDLINTTRNGEYGDTAPGDVGFTKTTMRTPINGAGRWPPNVLLDVEMSVVLDVQSGTTTSGKSSTTHEAYEGDSTTGLLRGVSTPDNQYSDTGGASRFFPVFKYNSKAPGKERPRVDDVAHPTVKPLELMRWLVRLVTPPNGFVLDPFAGSGTTIEAALLEGFDAVAIEREPTYIPLIEERIARCQT